MRPVLLGRIHGLFGVRGWLKIYSYTAPPANILDYPRWQLRQDDGEWRPMRLIDGRSRGKGLIAQLAPVDGAPLSDRDAAAALLGADIAVARADLPEPPPGEVYWVDLIDCRVETLQGTVLGRVTDMMDTGAYPVMVIVGEHQHLVPLVRGPVVQHIDTDEGRVTIDWDPDF